MVLTAPGTSRPSTHGVPLHAGSLAPIGAHSGRCLAAHALSRASCQAHSLGRVDFALRTALAAVDAAAPTAPPAVRSFLLAQAAVAHSAARNHDAARVALRAAEEGEVTGGATLTGLGLDSLAVVELVDQLAADLGGSSGAGESLSCCWCLARRSCGPPTSATSFSGPSWGGLGQVTPRAVSGAPSRAILYAPTGHNGPTCASLTCSTSPGHAAEHERPQFTGSGGVRRNRTGGKLSQRCTLKAMSATVKLPAYAVFIRVCNLARGAQGASAEPSRDW